MKIACKDCNNGGEARDFSIYVSRVEKSDFSLGTLITGDSGLFRLSGLGLLCLLSFRKRKRMDNVQLLRNLSVNASNLLYAFSVFFYNCVKVIGKELTGAGTHYLPHTIQLKYFRDEVCRHGSQYLWPHGRHRGICV